AEEAVDEVVKQLKEEENILYSKSETRNLPISGGEVGGSTGFERFKQQKTEEGLALDIPEDTLNNLIAVYGSNIDTIFKIYQANKEKATKEHLDPFVLTKLIYSME